MNNVYLTTVGSGIYMYSISMRQVQMIEHDYSGLSGYHVYTYTHDIIIDGRTPEASADLA